MMETIYTNSLYALIVANAVLLVAASFTVLRVERIIRKKRDFWDNASATSIRDHRKANSILSAFLDRRLMTIHNKIDQLARQKTPAAASQPTELPFEYAVRMTKRGASIEDLIRTCGLSKAEAQLMWRLHAQQSGAKSHSTH
jgi:hypothetical protein